jgi:hypothetical protein
MSHALAQVGAQGPPARRAASRVGGAARAQGSLLCAIWTSPYPNAGAGLTTSQA